MPKISRPRADNKNVVTVLIAGRHCAGFLTYDALLRWACVFSLRYTVIRSSAERLELV